MRKKAVQILLLCFIMVAVFSDSVMGWQDIQVRIERAEGIAAIVNDDSVSSRYRAIEDALGKAVEQAVGVMVSEETMTQNHQRLNDRIYKIKQEYIQNYKIISEVTEDSLYRVTVEVAVALGNLKNDLISSAIRSFRPHGCRKMISSLNLGESRFIPTTCFNYKQVNGTHASRA